jgi:hypothetical protein
LNVAIFNEDPYMFWDESGVEDNKIKDIKMMTVLIFLFLK